MLRLRNSLLAVAAASVAYVQAARADTYRCQADHASAATIPEARLLYEDGKLAESAAAYSRIAGNIQNGSAVRLAALAGLERALKAQACDQKAIDVQHERLALAERVGDEQARQQSLARLARLSVTRDSGEATRLANLVLDDKGHSPGGPDDNKSDAYTTLALIALARDQLSDADELLASARANATSSLRQAEAWRTASILRQADARFGSALDACRASLAKATEAADVEAAALAQICIAGALPADRKPEAVRIWEDARTKAAAMHTRRVEAYANLEEGRRGYTEARYSTRVQAQQYLVHATQLYGEIGDQSQERAAQLALASASYALGDDATAADAAQRSGVLSRNLGYTVEAAKTEHLLALIALRQSPVDRQAVLGRLQSALVEMERAAGPGDQARVLHDMAIVALSSHDTASAQRWLFQALNLLAGSQEANAESMRQQIGVALGWTLLEQGAVDTAIPVLRAVTAKAEGETRGQAWWGLARAYTALKQPKAARLYFERALGDIDPLRPHGSDLPQTASLSFDNNYSSLYREFAALLLRLNQPAKAHYVATLMQRMELVEAYWPQTRGDEQPSSLPVHHEGGPSGCEQEIAGREEAYTRLWLQREASTAAGQPPGCCPDAAGAGNCSGSAETARAYCELDSQVKTLRRELQRDENDCVARLNATSHDTAFAADLTFQAKWDKAIGSGATLAITIVENDQLDIIVRSRATAGYMVRSRPIGREGLDELVTRWKVALQTEMDQRKTLQGVKLAQDEARRAGQLQNGILRKLYTLLFDGLDNVLLPRRRDGRLPYLAIALDGPLRDIPIAALYDGRQYLSEKAAISVVTSTTLESRQFSDDSVKPGLVLGMSRLAEPALPNVEVEVKKVASTLHVEPHLDQDASASTLLTWLNSLNTQNLALHVAAHGTIGETPASTVVHLAEGDITGLQLAGMTEQLAYLRLVVLSACESAGVGQGNLPMGLAGLAANGARSVIGSLWPVDDQATTELMGAFYENWMAQHANGAAQALAAAQQRVRESYPHPFYWAAFVTIGRWD